MQHTTFRNYPIAIKGINESYNEELTAIETLVKSEIAYSGTASDLVSVLPYFVYFKFCENKRSETTATTGENTTVSEASMPSVESQIRAWNIGAKMLTDICAEKSATANKYYLSKISLL